MNVGGLFDGIGLLAFGLHLAGLEHSWLCEIDPFRRTVLQRRWPGVRIFDDVRAVGAATAEPVDVIAGGFPCKGASTAGKRNGFDHPETRLWGEMARCVSELRPQYVVVENVTNILGIRDGAVWGTVVGDLASLGYDVEWDCIPAAAFGAPHLRDRVVAVAADTDCASEGRLASMGRTPSRGDATSADTERNGLREQPESERRRSGTRIPAAAGEAVTDASRGGQPEQPELDSQQRQRLYRALGDNAQRRGVPVEWGEYEPAIRRWEAVHGPAPEPLVRRMDVRAAARVERSRLSALGDGVQVQLGLMVGRYLMQREQETAHA